MDDRPVKRARLENPHEGSLPTHSHSRQYGDSHIGGQAPVQLGDNLGIQNYYCPQISTHKPTDECVDKYEVLLKSLLFERIDARVHNINKALPRTCKWLFQHTNFKQWLAGHAVQVHNGFLWIKGKPGCGKSTIMKTVLEWIRRRVHKESMDQTIVHYFFNARAPSSLEKSSLGLYRSFTYQLLCSCPSARPLFTTKFALKEPGDSGDAWTKAELQDFLSDVVISAEPYSLWLFIDALDEGEQEDDVRQMIGFLVDLSERALEPGSCCTLRVCLSSRHYPHISIKKGLSLVVEDEPEHDQDINTYVQEKLTGFDSQDKDELRAEVCRKSAGIFLWVVLVVRMLNEIDDHGSLLTDMRKRLDTIPGDLNDLFAEILTKGVGDIEACIALLQWVTFSLRSLEPAELYLATEYSRSPANSTWSPRHEITVPSSDRLARYILNCSRGLVELTPAQPPVVQFIHETVRHFLIKSNGLASVLPAFSANLEGLSHEVLKTSCRRYIRASAVPNDLERYVIEGHSDKASYSGLKQRLRRDLPFIDYATSYVFGHAEHAHKHGISQESFLISRVNTEGVWQGLDRLWWNVLERFKARKYADNVTLLYFVTEQGFVSLCTTLLRLFNVVNARCGRYGYALQAACATGSEDIVLSLVANGAFINALGGEYGHALVAAILTKNFALVPVLEQHGACLDPALLHKAFLMSIARGYIQGVTTLLKLGAKVNGMNARREPALYAAVTKKYHDVVKLLLQHGAEVNAQGGEYGNALRAASARGDEKMVQILVDAGADINAQGGKYGNALHDASARGDEKMVQILVDAGADVNAQGGKYGNALRDASARGDEKMVQILVDAGADVNAQGGFDGNALRDASARGDEKMVQILVDAGADVNAQGGSYGNALQAASARGHEKVVQILVDAGADVNAQGGNDGNALRDASARGYEKVVRILVDAGADVNAQGGFYGNALRAASAGGHEKVVQILVVAGADFNAQGGFYGDALQAASARGHEKVVQILVDAGADVNAQEGFYGDALQVASARGHEKVVQILVDAGADLKIRNLKNKTLLI